MKNILNEKPNYSLTGRLLASVLFVSNVDLLNKKILDIGCGYGWCELNFLQRGIKEISAVEISEEFLKTVKQNIKDKRLVPKVGNAINLPFKNEFFDTVVSWEVIEHIPINTESKMFSEVFRVLKPDGHFYLSTPYTSVFSNILDPAWWLIGHRHYSFHEIKQLGEETGFVVETVKINGGWWSILGLLNLYFSKWILRKNSLYKEFFINKENVEYDVDYTKGFTNLFVKFTKKLKV